MKHITYADKSLLVGDEAADLLIEYTAVLGTHHISDNVDVKVFGPDGSDAVASFLLGEGAPLMAESVHFSIPEPENSAVVAYMRERVTDLTSPHYVHPAQEPTSEELDDLR